MRIVLRTCISLWLGLLLITGCSQIGLTYRHLDLIIPWSLNDYLDLDATQKDWLDERLKEHLSWHCSTQIPDYLTWLDRLQGMVETNQVTEQLLQIQVNQNNKPAQLAMSAFYNNQGDYAKAQTMLDGVKTTFPSNTLISILQADIYLNQNNVYGLFLLLTYRSKSPLTNT